MNKYQWGASSTTPAANVGGTNFGGSLSQPSSFGTTSSGGGMIGSSASSSNSGLQMNLGQSNGFNMSQPKVSMTTPALNGGGFQFKSSTMAPNFMSQPSSTSSSSSMGSNVGMGSSFSQPQSNTMNATNLTFPSMTSTPSTLPSMTSTPSTFTTMNSTTIPSMNSTMPAFSAMNTTQAAPTNNNASGSSASDINLTCTGTTLDDTCEKLGDDALKKLINAIHKPMEKTQLALDQIESQSKSNILERATLSLNELSLLKDDLGTEVSKLWNETKMMRTEEIHELSKHVHTISEEYSIYSSNGDTFSGKQKRFDYMLSKVNDMSQRVNIYQDQVTLYNNILSSSRTTEAPISYISNECKAIDVYNGSKTHDYSNGRHHDISSTGRSNSNSTASNSQQVNIDTLLKLLKAQSIALHAAGENYSSVHVDAEEKRKVYRGTYKSALEDYNGEEDQKEEGGKNSTLQYYDPFSSDEKVRSKFIEQQKVLCSK